VREGLIRYTAGHMKRFFRRMLAIPLAAVILVGQGCTKAPSQEARELSKQVVMNVWGVVDDYDAYEQVFTKFRQSHPNAEIRYKRFRLEEYEEKLLNAFAEDRGPDVFLIHNTWVDKYMPKLLPAPKSVKTAVQVVTGTVKKEVTTQVVNTPTITIRALKNDFPDFVSKNSVRRVDVSTTPDKKVFEERVVALPMSVDTLALYYNKDLLNASGIPTPPETWGQFQAQVQKIVKQDDRGNIIRAGAGMGLGSNVDRSPDIASLLMMQNGAEMTNENGDTTFTRTPQALEGLREIPPGLQAIQFYADFANPAKAVYTWNRNEPNSLDAFVQGTSAFYLGYNYSLPLIRARAPKLNLGITNVPQIENSPEVNFANYWMWTVSKKSASTDLAWLFVNDMTGKDLVTSYLKAAKRPAARKALLTEQLEDEDIGVFSSQVLTAKTWYRGKDPKSADQALIELLDAAPGVEETQDLNELLRKASERIEQTRF